MKNYVYVRKSVTWGGRRYEVRGKTEEEACAKLAQLLESLHERDLTVSVDATVDQWFRRWKEVYKEPSGITPKSLALYDEKYEGYIRPAIGHRKLRDIRDLDLQAILNTQAGKSYSHLSKLRMVLQELFRQARRSRLIVYDPAEGLVLPETSRGSHRTITDKERKHLLAVAQDHPAGLWVLTILYAGLRPGETAALLWSDIDFQRNEIHVYKAVESGSRTIKRPKTEAGTRDIPMRQELRQALQQQLMEYGHIDREAQQLERKHGWKQTKISPAVTYISTATAKMRLRFGDTQSKIAGMMIQGNTRGMILSCKNRSKTQNIDPQVQALSRKLLDTEMDNIRQMKPFL